MHGSTSAKKNSIRAERLHQSARALSEPSEEPRWWITPHLVSIPGGALHIALQTLFHRFFSHCRSPNLHQPSGIGANCDQMSEWVHWVHMHLDCIAMGDVAIISPPVPSTCAQHAFPSLLIIHIIPSLQIYVAIDNPLFVLSISCLTSSGDLWKYVREADDISDAEKLQSNACRCLSHLDKCRDVIQVT